MTIDAELIADMRDRNTRARQWIGRMTNGFTRSGTYHCELEVPDHVGPAPHLTIWASLGDVPMFLAMVEAKEARVERLQAENARLADYLMENYPDAITEVERLRAVLVSISANLGPAQADPWPWLDLISDEIERALNGGAP